MRAILFAAHGIVAAFTDSLMNAHQPAVARPDRNHQIISAVCFFLAVAVAISLRFYLIGIKPFHHDESVNSYFLLNLWRSGNYKYNPENYHGPTLYYFALAAVKMFGLTDFALRFMPAFWGVLTVLALWPVRRLLGLIGTPATAMLLALSPGLVYFSRDFIHESSFGFFSLGLVICAWRYAETKKFVWSALGAASAALLFATKETAVITVVVLALAALCAAMWDIGRRLLHTTSGLDLVVIWREIISDTRAVLPTLDHCGAALIIFLFLNIVFYSSFFTNWSGVPDAVKSVLMWTGRGVSRQEHYHNAGYYLGIALKLELPLVIGALAGALAALWRGTRFGLFLFAWTAGISLGYSLIPYKTPWLMVSLLIPMALLCGVAAETVFAGLPAGSLRMIWLAVLLAALIPCARLAWQQNIYHHADNQNELGYFLTLGKKYNLRPWTDTQYGYVYAQTDVSLLDMERAIREAAAQMPLDKDTEIYVASPDYWPLPWYLRDYNRTSFAGTIPLELTAPIIVVAPSQQDKIDPMLTVPYYKESYTLRPGVELLLYTRSGETETLASPSSEAAGAAVQHLKKEKTQ